MPAVDIEVTYVRKLNSDGKVKAFADVKFARELIVKGFAIIEGNRGLFVTFPKEVGKDGKWYETVKALNEGFKEEVQNKVLEAYDRQAESVTV